MSFVKCACSLYELKSFEGLVEKSNSMDWGSISGTRNRKGYQKLMKPALVQWMRCGCIYILRRGVSMRKWCTDSCTAFKTVLKQNVHPKRTWQNSSPIVLTVPLLVTLSYGHIDFYVYRRTVPTKTEVTVKDGCAARGKAVEREKKATKNRIL
jgi:hypothetical protein